MSTFCRYYDLGVCSSCSQIEVSYDKQLETKEAHCRSLLQGREDLLWLPHLSSPESRFRNKAKMVVGGTRETPVLGILKDQNRVADLTSCPLYPDAMKASFRPLKEYISESRLVPYNLETRKGELKYIIVTLSQYSGSFMVRFVLRSRESLGMMKKKLPLLMESLPQVEVVTANIQPVHQAILEGEEEIILTERESISMMINGLPLHLRPRSFFQTNSHVASGLYMQARKWVQELDPSAIWDLFCGAGAFALHCADGLRDVTGIEISEEAIEGAIQSSKELSLKRVHFRSMDATGFALDSVNAPPMVIVNPPRRGIGEELCQYLDASNVRWIIYSSCNTESLLRDVNRMPSFKLRRAGVLDMFPHTLHYEVITLLEKK